VRAQGPGKRLLQRTKVQKGWGLCRGLDFEPYGALCKPPSHPGRTPQNIESYGKLNQPPAAQSAPPSVVDVKRVRQVRQRGRGQLQHLGGEGFGFGWRLRLLVSLGGSVLHGATTGTPLKRIGPRSQPRHLVRAGHWQVAQRGVAKAQVPVVS
jgi:hypothetical protein